MRYSCCSSSIYFNYKFRNSIFPNTQRFFFFLKKQQKHKNLKLNLVNNDNNDDNDNKKQRKYIGDGRMINVKSS